VSNVVEIGQTAAEIWQLFDFSRFKMAAAASLNFQNFKLLMVGRLKRVECVIMPNLVEIGQTAAEILHFSIFQDGSRRHLAF